MFKGMSLKGKLMAQVTALSLMLLTVGALGYVGIAKVSQNYRHVSEINLGNAIYLGDMVQYAGEVTRNFLGMILPGVSPEEVARHRKDLDEAMKGYAETNKKYEEVPFVEGEQALYDAMNGAWLKYRGLVEEALRLMNSKDPAAREKLKELVGHQMDGAQKAQADARRTLIDFQVKESAKWSGYATDAARLWNTIALALAVAGFTLSLIAGFLFSRSLSRTLQDIATKLGGGADQVASAAQQISASSEELSSSATEQAASLQQTASSIEQMSAMVSKNAENAGKSRELAGSGQNSANRGKQVVEEMIRSIEEINTSNGEIMKQIEESNREISDIVKVIAEIGNKTKVINDIVFQTKLLSFNASVEAARAGEHGKGFAVVAEEVGNLAQMSGNAAKEISGMLEGSIQKVENIVNDTKARVERLVASGKEKVENGTVVARRCGEVLEEIVKSVGEINGMSGEISTSSEEQAQGVQEITRAMSQLDQVTQQNASASEQAASAAEELSAQADVLREMVRELRLTVEGAAGAGGPVSRPANERPQVERAHAPVPERRPKPVPAAEGKVVKLAQPAPKPAAGGVAKRASGSDYVPSENDPRFNDV